MREGMLVLVPVGIFVAACSGDDMAGGGSAADTGEGGGATMAAGEGGSEAGGSTAGGGPSTGAAAGESGGASAADASSGAGASTGEPMPPAADDIDEALALIEAGPLTEWLTYLTSDELRGREAFTQDEETTAAYVAARFEEFGLEPARTDSSGAPIWCHEASTSGYTTRNCLGILKGTDLADEYVIWGGHMDGQGMCQNDTVVCPAADDNGSATVSVMETARAFMKAGIRARRSIIFMTFGAEEPGLVGSGLYASNPVIPLEQTVAVLNCEMIGTPGPLIALMTGTSPSWAEVLASGNRKFARMNIEVTGIENQEYGASDHLSFVNRNIPAAMTGGGGPRQCYHAPCDDMDWVDTEQIATYTKYNAFLVWELANLPERPRFTPPPDCPMAPCIHEQP